MKKLLLVVLVLLAFVLAVSALAALFVGGGGRGISFGKKIALVTVAGPIMDSRQAVKEIKEYADDEGVAAIVLRVESPGGAVAPSQEIYTEVRRAAALKTVVVSMGALAASGGYYISAPATRIVANPGTLTGSIGVIMEIPNFKVLMEKVGVRTEVIRSGEHKGMASVMRDMTDEDRAILQTLIDDVFAQFVADVAEARGMAEEDVRALADGRVYTGRQALDLGLVDELGGLEHAVSVAADLSGIEGEPNIVSRRENLSILDLLRQSVTERLGGLADGFVPVKISYLYSP